MDDTSRRSLIIELDAGIAQAEAEAEKLRELRGWLVGLGSGASPITATIGRPDTPVRRKPSVRRTTGLTLADYIVKVLDEADHPLTVDEVTREALRIGWTTTATEPDSTVRTILRRVIKRGQVEKVAGRRYSLIKSPALL